MAMVQGTTKTTLTESQKYPGIITELSHARTIA
jgi:hypothetical protein